MGEFDYKAQALYLAYCDAGKIKSMQLKTMVFEVTFKSKLLEISQQRGTRKIGLVAMLVYLLISLILLIYNVLSP